MDVLKRGYHNSLKVIKQHKLIFFSLIILQILTLAILASVGIKFTILISENNQEIGYYLDNANYDSESLKSGQPFIKETVALQKSYQSLIKNIWWLVLISFGIYLFFDGLNWSLTNYLFKKTNLFKNWLNFTILSLLFIVPVSLIIYSIFKSAVGIDLGVFELVIYGLTFLAVITYYFLAVAYSFLEKDLQSIFKNLQLIGIRKVFPVILVTISNLVLISISLILIYLSQDNLLAMTASILLLSLILTLTRIFFVGNLKSLSQKE
ncbi:hypothetical protein HOC13_03875 [Candidatus Woesearchaeota archaeon]|jgi:hypothetical protein|nr:hypothetical protein [Candidatus Woesearchaeota archaeon]